MNIVHIILLHNNILNFGFHVLYTVDCIIIQNYYITIVD